MADLDDFFNKRQNKKKKNLSKKLDEFAKNSEATAPSPLPATAETPVGDDVTERLGEAVDQQLNLADSTPAVVTQTSNGNFNADEDWKPFDSDEHKDYSGLRVNLLQNWKDENDDEDEVEQEDEVEKKPACPWSKVPQQQPVSLNDDDETDYSKQPVKLPEPEPTPVQQQQQQPQASESSEGSRYIPPHLRGQIKEQQQPQQQSFSTISKSAASSTSTAPSSGSYIPPHLRNTTNTSQSSFSSSSQQSEFQTASTKRYNRNQPNINDVSEFPSLGDMATTTGSQLTEDVRNENKYEQPKRSGKVEQRTNTNRIGLENKFDALSS